MVSLVGKKVKVRNSPNILLNRKTGTVIRDISPFGLLGIKIYIVEMDRPFFQYENVIYLGQILERGLK